jgi:hypothetical protein
MNKTGAHQIQKNGVYKLARTGGPNSGTGQGGPLCIQKKGIYALAKLPEPHHGSGSVATYGFKRKAAQEQFGKRDVL